MKKPYLLLAGMGYYPSSRTGDWIGCFETEDEAHDKLITLPDYRREWYEIVDLRKWTESE